MTLLLQASRKWWDVRRFGLTPDKWVPRLTNSDEPRILCVTVPKAGTHLLERALCLHPTLYRKVIRTVHGDNLHRWGDLPDLLDRLRSGQILVSHLHYSDERYQAVMERGIKCLYMVRDPRDVVVSHAFYVRKEKEHQQHQLYMEQPDIRSCILLAINGHRETNLLSIRETLDQFDGWRKDGTLLVRFEDLVGAEGGGSADVQLNTLGQIFHFIGVHLDSSSLHAISQNLFSDKSPTFRKGGTGRWREHFDPEMKERFKELMGDMLIKYGYEKDYAW